MSLTSSHRADGMSSKYDVLVIGGGNAALCAAITARAAGATVLRARRRAKVLSRRQQPAHPQPALHMTRATEILTDAYPEEEFWDDLLQVTGGQTDEALARHDDPRVRGPAGTGCGSNGVRLQPSLGGTLQPRRTNAFFLGGGKAMVNALLPRPPSGSASRSPTTPRSTDLDDRGRRVPSVHASSGTVTGETRSARRSLVAAAGGFEANLDWLKRILGRGRRQLPRSAARPTTTATC